MTVTLDDLGHVAEIEFGNLVAERQPLGLAGFREFMRFVAAKVSGDR
jgi:hypothetical protein